MRKRSWALVMALSTLVLGPGCRGGEQEAPGQVAASSQQGPAPEVQKWGREIGPPLDERSSGRRASGPPVSLSASDGTGLRLVSLEGRALVDDPLALTELRLTFENPEGRELEGTFSITLPTGAAVSRFAMRIGNRWQEGEVVEKQAARRAYEDFLHRKQDPALLEQAAGNEFSARVFPIPARGRKELVITYSQELRGDESYAVPLRGLPEIERLELAAYLPGRPEPVHTLKAERQAPAADFGFKPGPRPAAALRNGELVVARVRPYAAAKPEPLSSLLVLFDTSASRALGFDAQLESLRTLVADVAAREGASTPVSVLCFDQGTELIFEGAAGGFGEGEIEAIKKRGALGASDLGAALAAAGERAKAREIKRVLLIGDGVATAGDAVGDKVGAAALGLKAAGVERLDALVVGGIRDESMLTRAVRAGLAHDGTVIEGEAESAEIGRRLRAATRSAELKVEGATFQYPRSLAGAQAGDDVLVYAELPAGQPLVINVDGEPQRLAETHEAEPALLRRAWARAKIASLLDEQKREGVQASVSKQIVDLSVKHRVLSPYTALLVLETEQDYARFNLDRRSLADILAPGAGRIDVINRSPDALKAGKAAPQAQKETQSDSKSASAEGQKKKDAAEPSPESKPDAAPGPAAMRAPPPPSPTMARPSMAAGHAAASRGAIRIHEVLVDAPKFDEDAMPAKSASGSAAGGVAGGVVGGVVGGVLAGEPGGVAMPPSPALPLDRDDPWGPVADAAGKSAERPPAPTAAPVAVAEPPSLPEDPSTIMRPRPRLEGEREGGRPSFSNPYTGKFREVMGMISGHRVAPALDFALAWRKQSPGDVLALVALGAAYEAAGEIENAGRAYGSIIDLFPARADLRRFAGARLEHLAEGKGLPLAVDSFEKALEQRPDHPSSHRLLAFALAKRGDYARALDVVLAGHKRRYPEGRFAGVKRVLREDAGLLGAALVRAEPERQAEVEAKLKQAGAWLERGPSIRFVLNWETDANDVDFHIYDAEGGHAFFQNPSLPNSGGELYADVTTGYGPECFTVRKSRGGRSSLYTLQAHYYSRGPMGYGMGKLEIVEHDGKGGLSFDERPFIVMTDRAFVNLGTVGRSTLDKGVATASLK